MFKRIFKGIFGLILFIAIALGYLVSTFFLELLLIGRSFATMS